jgi:hypothetical protein
MKVIDLLSCPNCGEPATGGEFCNLSCRREWEEKQQSKTRAAKHARMRGLVQHLCRIAPEPITLDACCD